RHLPRPRVGLHPRGPGLRGGDGRGGHGRPDRMRHPRPRHRDSHRHLLIGAHHMTAYDIDAWLGDTEATDEQRAALVRAADRIAARWPDPDLADTREQALTGAAQIILGDAALDEIGSAYVAARAVEQEAHAAL